MDVLQRTSFLQPSIDAEHTIEVAVVKDEVKPQAVVIKVPAEIRNLINDQW